MRAGSPIFCDAALWPLSAVRHALGDAAGAAVALDEYLRLIGHRVDSDYALSLPLATRAVLGADDVPLAEALAAHVPPSVLLYRHALVTVEALLAEARGEHEAAAAGFAAAAARWHEHGVPFEEAQALLGHGRCLVAPGRAPEAVAPLTSAREIFARLGARPALAETDEFLQLVATA